MAAVLFLSWLGHCGACPAPGRHAFSARPGLPPSIAQQTDPSSSITRQPWGVRLSPSIAPGGSHHDVQHTLTCLSPWRLIPPSGFSAGLRAAARAPIRGPRRSEPERPQPLDRASLALLPPGSVFSPARGPCGAGIGGVVRDTPCSLDDLQVIRGRQVPPDRAGPRSAHRGAARTWLVLGRTRCCSSPSLGHQPLEARIPGSKRSGIARSGQKLAIGLGEPHRRAAAPHWLSNLHGQPKRSLRTRHLWHCRTRHRQPPAARRTLSQPGPAGFGRARDPAHQLEGPATGSRAIRVGFCCGAACPFPPGHPALRPRLGLLDRLAQFRPRRRALAQGRVFARARGVAQSRRWVGGSRSGSGAPPPIETGGKICFFSPQNFSPGPGPGTGGAMYEVGATDDQSATVIHQAWAGPPGHHSIARAEGQWPVAARSCLRWPGPDPARSLCLYTLSALRRGCPHR